jgi:glutamine amidotransferase
MVTIANIGVGNYASIANMLRFLEIDVEVQNSPKDIEKITHLIVPGVGSFDAGMRLMIDSGWATALREISPRTQVLGICLGMQLLTLGSDEGDLEGLGLVKGWCRKFDDSQVVTPHMGWNKVVSVKPNPILTSGSLVDWFYFSHSYFVEIENISQQIGETKYSESFTSAFQVGNVFGCQFHPEKSHKFGMKLLENFAKISC